MRCSTLLFALAALGLPRAQALHVKEHLQTYESWRYLARFCYDPELSRPGKGMENVSSAALDTTYFHYKIEHRKNDKLILLIYFGDFNECFHKVPTFRETFPFFSYFCERRTF